MLKKTEEINDWIRTRIKPEQVEKYLDRGKDFINEQAITEALGSAKNPDPKMIEDILEKSLSIETLSLGEAAALLNVTDRYLWEKMAQVAIQIKKKVYDNRIVTFAPLYMGNFCVNNCLYCGFRKDNSAANRKVLSLDEIQKETEALAGKIGHKRLIVVYGEHPRTDIGYIASSIERIYSTRVNPVRDNLRLKSETFSNGVKTKKGWGQIRRVNVNAPPFSIEELKILKEKGIGTYQVFQETYHRRTYQDLHPKGTIKADYAWRLYSMHRAFEAGVDDVGLGVLFGLYDWRFEVLALVLHSIELENRFGIGPHTISFPRLEPADNTPFTQNSRYKVSDEDFLKLITIIRLAVPYTGMILTARENAGMRRKAVVLGCTQTDASSRIGIGAYSNAYDSQQGQRQQFFLGDTRSLDEVIREFAQMGYITSFCTAGYRCGRTGKCIMDLLRNGSEGKFCKLNAVLTFREWLDDFASEQTKKEGEKIIFEELEEIKLKLPKIYPQLIEYYERIKKGERDLYF